MKTNVNQGLVIIEEKKEKHLKIILIENLEIYQYQKNHEKSIN